MFELKDQAISEERVIHSIPIKGFVDNAILRSTLFKFKLKIDKYPIESPIAINGYQNLQFFFVKRGPILATKELEEIESSMDTSINFNLFLLSMISNKNKSSLSKVLSFLPKIRTGECCLCIGHALRATRSHAGHKKRLLGDKDKSVEMDCRPCLFE
ncbi:hypothetical protein BpHYR1_007938 [Brachionus plicatilis]|uniref:Uncharacterized protein n=1 Tax=Brachionus plicatilis TaxID=10195 RepID=A0A3M7R0U3_BRAPC|nr:hypothetical protein BpHYR1_007938 [Brachionus plicatilis]